MDAIGGVVPDATVVITGAETGNVVRQLKTIRWGTAKGTATAPLLPPATYNLQVPAPGFEQLVRNGITLNVGATVSPTLKFQTGGATETVTVIGEAPLLQQKSAVLSQTFDRRPYGSYPFRGGTTWNSAI